MKYRVVVAGVPVECDSIEDAIALAKAASGGASKVEAKGKVSPGSSVVTGNTRWTEARMTSFLSLLKGDQRKLVDALLDNPDGRTDAQLLSELGLKDGRALAGVFTGLWKNAKKVGADPQEVYERQQITIADRRGYEYTPSASFRQVAGVVRSTVNRK